MVVGLTLKSFIYFKLLSVYGARVQFHSSACRHQFSKHHLLKKLFFAYLVFLGSFVKDLLTSACVFILLSLFSSNWLISNDLCESFERKMILPSA